MPVSKPLELAADTVVLFPEGVPGFESARRFVVLRHEDFHPLLFLQDLDNRLLSLPVIPAQAVDQGYRLKLESRDRAVLGLPEAPAAVPNVICLLVVVLPAEGAKATCNLFAPIVINPATMWASKSCRSAATTPRCCP